jgi:hypothetical protein
MVMATNMIDKSVYQAPTGMPLNGETLDIEIVNPEMVTLDDGSVEITLMPEAEAGEEDEFNSNLAEKLDERILTNLSSELTELVEADITSRKDWSDTYVKGLEVLGFKYEERTDPWEDACGVYSTVLSEAAIRFQAETMSETFPAAGPVKAKILGEVTKEKEAAAERVRADMNYQLTERMVEYRSEHERMLFSLSLAGSAFKKVYYDPRLRRQVSVYIAAEEVIVPYGASHIEMAERVTHTMRKTKNEMAFMQSSGFYRDVELGEPVSFFSDIEKRKAEENGYTLTSDDRYMLYEIHADLVIEGVDDEDGLAKPYIVTIEKGTGTVLAIRRNWEPDDDLQLKRQFFVHYGYIPGFGFYHLGLIHIVGGYARAGTSILRQLVDAGTLSNLPGGLKSRGLRIKGDETPVAPGEFRDVDVPSGTIRDNILPLPYKEPSQVLAALLEKITQEGRRLAAISDLNISDMSAQAPVGTTLAILERTLKPMAAVQARVHFAMKQEFKLLKAIIAEYADEPYDYIPEGVDRRARAADYAQVEVIPVSDPNSATMAQRVVQYQAAMMMAKDAPQIYDLQYLHRQMLEVLGIKNADKIVPMQEDQKPRDPISENMSVLVGKPLKAFIYQDHEAHIATHMSFMQDPMIMQTIGQNPQAQQIMAALQAHIAEHLGFNYRKQIEERLGADLTVPDAELPESIEVELSRLVAQAARQLTQQHTQQAQQQQAQQQAQDPLFQIEQQKLQTQQQEVQRKAQKDQADIQLAKGKLELEARKLVIEAQKSKADMDNKQQESQSKQRMELLTKAIEMQNGATARTDRQNEAKSSRRAAVLDKLMASKSAEAPKTKAPKKPKE